MNAPSEAALRAAVATTLERHDGAALVALIPYAAWLGVQLQLRRADADGGATDGDPLGARFSLPFRAALTGNPMLPAVHGGVIAGFMENAAMLYLLLLPAPADMPLRIPRSIDFSIDYLHSAHTTTLDAQCTVERIGRRVAQVQIRCTQGQDDAGRPRSIAVARAHFQLAALE